MPEASGGRTGLKAATTFAAKSFAVKAAGAGIPRAYKDGAAFRQCDSCAAPIGPFPCSGTVLTAKSVPYPHWRLAERKSAKRRFVGLRINAPLSGGWRCPGPTTIFAVASKVPPAAGRVNHSKGPRLVAFAPGLTISRYRRIMTLYGASRHFRRARTGSLE